MPRKPSMTDVIRASERRIVENRKAKNPTNNNKNMKNKATAPNSQNLVSGGGGSVNTIASMPWMPVFPASVTRLFRYSSTFSASTTSGAITSTYVFRANDVFDPDFTGTGHQPMGTDPLFLWFNHAVVLRANIHVVFKNTTASTPTVCLRVDADSTPITVIDRIVEFGGCVTEVLEIKGDYGANKSLTLSADILRLQGVNKSAITADPSLRCSAAAAPTEVTYFHVTMWDTLGASGSATCDVIIEQTATFLEPRTLTQSQVDVLASLIPNRRQHVPQYEAKHDDDPVVVASTPGDTCCSQ